MSVAHIEGIGFWASLWRRLTGGSPVIERAAETTGRASAPPMLEARVAQSLSTVPVVTPVRLAVAEPVVAIASVAANGHPRQQDFMLAARLASTQSLNPPKLREGKAPVTPREIKPVAAGRKAKPKAPVTAAKKTMPQRHVWLSSRPQTKSADIVRLVPRSGQQNAKRAA